MSVAHSNPTPPCEVVVIGAGFSGLCLAIRLRQAGVEDFVVLEKANRPGGVWRDNTYPGAACDIPSILYSFSFDPGAEWSRKYPEQAEIRDYLEACVERHGLSEHLRYGVEVESATYDDEAGEWRIRSTDGTLRRARVLVSGVGQLNRPRLPEAPGLETFSGPAFHSARWDPQFDWRDRRVAVIGNGASAIQFVPVLARDTAALRVFQRSPNWIMRKRDHEITPRQRDRWRRFPFLRRAGRMAAYWAYEARFGMFAKGGPGAWLLEKYLRRHMTRRIAPGERGASLLPDYPAGCKRILLSGDYLKALQRPHVSVEPEGLARVEGNRLLGGSGEWFEADAIVFATGFHSTSFLAPMTITGREGRSLAETWRDGAHAHLGISVPGFPNLFLLYGPNTNLGHNSVIVMIESQVSYVIQAIRRLREDDDAKAIEVRPDAMNRFDREMRRQARRTVWTRGCRNWYTTDSGRLVNNWPLPSWRYLRRTRRWRERDFVVERR